NPNSCFAGCRRGGRHLSGGWPGGGDVIGRCESEMMDGVGQGWRLALFGHRRQRRGHFPLVLRRHRCGPRYGCKSMACVWPPACTAYVRPDFSGSRKRGGMAMYLPSCFSVVCWVISVGAGGGLPPREGRPGGAAACACTVMRTGPSGASAMVYLPFSVIRACSTRPWARWNRTVREGSGWPLSVTVPETEAAEPQPASSREQAADSRQNLDMGGSFTAGWIGPSPERERGVGLAPSLTLGARKESVAITSHYPALRRRQACRRPTRSGR